ncbi:hypothetical protein ACSBR2_034439 [Camellia fascicularis]
MCLIFLVLIILDYFVISWPSFACDIKVFITWPLPLFGAERAEHLCHFTLFFSVYIALPLFGRDDDLDDGEIDSFIDSETHRCTTLISNRNPQKMRSKKDLDRRSASPWLQDPN